MIYSPEARKYDEIATQAEQIVKENRKREQMQELRAFREEVRSQLLNHVLSSSSNYDCRFVDNILMTNEYMIYLVNIGIMWIGSTRTITTSFNFMDPSLRMLRLQSVLFLFFLTTRELWENIDVCHEWTVSENSNYTLEEIDSTVSSFSSPRAVIDPF